MGRRAKTGADSSGRRSTKGVFYVITPVLSILLTLLLIEFGLAFFHPIPHAIEDNMYFEPDPFTGYKLKANSVGFFIQGIEGKTNSLGYRDDEFELTPSPDTTRILVIGDSFTVGANVTQEEAYPQVLETLLAEHATSKVEVINAGVGGWNPFHYAQYYEHYGRQLAPNMVVVGFFVGNDTYSQEMTVDDTRTAVMGRRVSRKSASNRTLPPKIFLYEHFHLVRLLMTRINRITIAYDFEIPREDCRDFTPRYLVIQRQKLAYHLKQDERQERLAGNSLRQIARLKTLTEIDSIPILIFLIPDENQVNPHLRSELLKAEPSPEIYDFDMPQPLIIEKLTEIGVPFLDLLPNFREDGRCLYMNDTHWNATGHELAAQLLSHELRRLSLL